MEKLAGSREWRVEIRNRERRREKAKRRVESKGRVEEEREREVRKDRGEEEVRLKRRKNPKTAVDEFWLPPEEHNNASPEYEVQSADNNILKIRIIIRK